MKFVSHLHKLPAATADFSRSGMNKEWMGSTPQLQDVLELMHHIQSRLSVKEAARTSVLSKSWLQAWSTIPTLRFHVPKEQNKKHMKLVDVERTLIRYIRDNIPIKRFQLFIDIENQESASLAENLIRIAVTKTCVQELSLTIHLYSVSLHLPDEILLGKNLTKIRVSATRGIHSVWMMTTHQPKCLSLRELHLWGVCISEEVLHDILLSCRFLVKLELLQCSHNLNTIKVKNLPCLTKLLIHTSDGGSTTFEINHVPNLRLFSCNVHIGYVFKQPLINANSISLGGNVRELTLGGDVITDNTSLDMIIKSGLPFLEILTLDLKNWTLTSFHFTSSSIKRFSLLSCPRRLVHGVHVYAPKLLFLCFSGNIMPSLLFPVSTLEHIIFRLSLRPTLEASFFLKMREALTLSSKCDVHITTSYFITNDHDPPFDIDDLRTRLPFPPARNVQRLSFQTTRDECMWERSRFFDAFFEICHPKHVSALPDLWFKHKNHFCKLMLTEVLEKNYNTDTTTNAYWLRYLKCVQIKRRSRLGNWETLTDSHTTFLQGQAPHVSVRFKLIWR